MKTTTALTIALISSHIGWFGAWLYTSIDKGVTIAYHQDTIVTTERSLQQALSLAQHNVIGKTVEYVKAVVPRDLGGAEPFVKEGCLNYGEICLQLDQHQVIAEIKTFSFHE